MNNEIINYIGGAVASTLNIEEMKKAWVSIPVTEEELDMWGKLEALMKVKKERMDKAKKDLEKDPKSITGYFLNPGRIDRKVKSATKAYSAVKHEIEAEKFAGCCTLSIPKLEDIFYKLNKENGFTREETKIKVSIMLEGIIEEKQCASTLCSTKKVLKG